LVAVLMMDFGINDNRLWCALMQHMLRLGEHRYMLLSLLPAASGLECLHPQNMHTNAAAPALTSAQQQQLQQQQQFVGVWTKVLMRPIEEVLQKGSVSSKSSSSSSTCGDEEFSLDVGMGPAGGADEAAASGAAAGQAPVKPTVQQQQLLAQVVRLLHQCPYINSSTDKQQQQQLQQQQQQRYAQQGASSTGAVDVGAIAMALYSLGSFASAATSTEASISGPHLAVHSALAIQSPHARAAVITRIVAADAKKQPGKSGADGAVAVLDVLTAARTDENGAVNISGYDSDLIRLVLDTIDRHNGHAALMVACRSNGKGYFESLVAHLVKTGRIERIVTVSLSASQFDKALELVKLFHRAHPNDPSAQAVAGDDEGDKWEPLRAFVIASGVPRSLLSVIPME
jgi:hypothetical protein